MADGALINGNAELDQLEAEHRELKQRVFELERRAHLTPEEKIEAANLKKQKLQTKDAIEALRS